MGKDAGNLEPRALLAGASGGAVAVKTSGGSQNSTLGIMSPAIVLLGTYPASLKAGKQTGASTRVWPHYSPSESVDAPQ